MELHVKIVEARNVPAADMNGKSDPYVKLSTDKSKSPYLKTKVLKKTLTPKWDQEFTIKVNFVSDILSVAIYDEDKLSKDDKLGYFDIRIHDMNIGIVEDRWYKMNKPKGIKEDVELHMITHLVYEGLPAWKNLDLLFVDLFVNVIEAKNLPKMDVNDSDPYVNLTISTDTEKWCKTKVINNNNNPKWNESFLFWVTNPTVDRLLFQVKDKDLVADDLIGTLEIPLVSITVGQPIEKWFDITPVKNGRQAGQIMLFICMSPKGTQWTGSPKKHPRYDEIFKNHPIGMPDGGFPPEGCECVKYPMPKLEA